MNKFVIPGQCLGRMFSLLLFASCELDTQNALLNEEEIAACGAKARLVYILLYNLIS